MDDFPVKNRKRAKRRFLKQKMKQKAKHVAKYVFGWMGRRNEEDIEWFACRAADNLKNCSCSMCRNPRRNKEKTIQEKRIEESFMEQLND
jgi:hypothetical protein